MSPLRSLLLLLRAVAVSMDMVILYIYIYIHIYTLPTGKISVSGFPSMIATREGCAKSTCQLPDLSYSSRSQKDIETKSMDNGHFSVF